MKRTVVIYKSTSGFTKKYAEWIAQSLKCELFNHSSISQKEILSYDVIIFGGSLHAVGISGIDIIKKNLSRMSDKKIIVFATGASPARKEILSEIIKRNFNTDEQKQIKFFYLRGGFDFQKLNFVNKLLMTLMKLKIKSKKNWNSDELGMMRAFSNPVDFTDKKNLDGLLKYLNTDDS